MDGLADALKLIIPLLAAVIAWYFNERHKRAWEEYLRKEDKYCRLLALLRGLYVATQDTSMKKQFLDELNQCWLYCPDDIIRKAYTFVNTVSVGVERSDQDRASACGDLVAAIRRDILSRRLVKTTQLTAADFRHLQAT